MGLHGVISDNKIIKEDTNLLCMVKFKQFKDALFDMVISLSTVWVITLPSAANSTCRSAFYILMSFGLIVKVVLCHNLNINTKEKHIIKSILKNDLKDLEWGSFRNVIGYQNFEILVCSPRKGHWLKHQVIQLLMRSLIRCNEFRT